LREGSGWSWRVGCAQISVALLLSSLPTPVSPASALEDLLPRMGRVAELYRDHALRFTCDETIHYSGRGEPVLRKFAYIYRFDKTAGVLQDYRIPLSSAKRTAPATDSLEIAGLPAYLLRAYSWVFIFDREHQPAYRFELVGQDEIFGRRGLLVRFAPTPEALADPQEDLWYGTATIDAETYQILRVQAVNADEQRQQESLDRSLASDFRGDGLRGVFTFSRYSTDFDMERNGLRFPGRVLIERAEHWVHGSAGEPGVIKELPIFVVTQTYKRYRFFDVRTRDEIRAIVAGDAPP
jgi:hypothetical protein